MCVWVERETSILLLVGITCDGLFSRDCGEIRIFAGRCERRCYNVGLFRVKFARIRRRGFIGIIRYTCEVRAQTANARDNVARRIDAFMFYGLFYGKTWLWVSSGRICTGLSVYSNERFFRVGK